MHDISFFDKLREKLSDLEGEFMNAETTPDRLDWIEARISSVAKALDTTQVDLKNARLRRLGLR